TRKKTSLRKKKILKKKKVENPIEHEDGTVPDSVYEVGELSTAAIP
ncbi:hypothetical protein Tco_0416470, partial [Tanacetum coccineum]